MLIGISTIDTMNDVAKEKLKKPSPLTRADIADVLLSIGPAGEERDQKRMVVKTLCIKRGEGKSAEHGLWDALDDFPEF